MEQYNVEQINDYICDLERQVGKLRKINKYYLKVLEDNGIAIFEDDLKKPTGEHIIALWIASVFGAAVSILAIMGVI